MVAEADLVGFVMWPELQKVEFVECAEAVGASEVSSVLLLENHATVLNGFILNTFSNTRFYDCR